MKYSITTIVSLYPRQEIARAIEIEAANASDACRALVQQLREEYGVRWEGMRLLSVASAGVRSITIPTVA